MACAPCVQNRGGFIIIWFCLILETKAEDEGEYLHSKCPRPGVQEGPRSSATGWWRLSVGGHCWQMGSSSRQKYQYGRDINQC